MFDRSAIEAISEAQAIKAACSATIAAFDTSALLHLPSDFTRHDLEAFLPHRRRARGLMRTAYLEPFIRYTLQHAEEGASIFVDTNTMSAAAVLNLGTPASPGQADNLAALKLERTAAFQALHTVLNRPLDQRDAAEFLEDWLLHIKAKDDQENDIPVKQAVAALRRLTIETLQKLESEEKSLSASRSAFESVTAKSLDPIPTRLLFTCHPYADLAEREFSLRVSIQTGAKNPQVVLRPLAMERHVEEMGKELAAMVAIAIFDQARSEGITRIPVLLGSYQATR